jgi:regulator of sirC expression with transglutaminase-like and TPR domain
MIDQKDITSLIKLLDDPDAEIYEHVHNKLLSYGSEVIQYLENAFGEAFDPLQQERIPNLVHEIQFGLVKQELELWYLGGAFDLLQGALIVNKYQYPDLDEQRIINYVESIKRDVWLQMMYEGSPVEQVKLINNVFYNIYGFTGNTANHNDPQNSYLSQVIETKKGNQISLAIIYSTVAQKLDIPIYGVNLPQHFIMAYVDESRQNGIDNGVLFYINTFNKGLQFSKRDVDQFLKQHNFTPDPHYYEPCTNVDIIRRVLRNLISSYEKLGSMDKVTELNQMLELLQRDLNG